MEEDSKIRQLIEMNISQDKAEIKEVGNFTENMRGKDSFTHSHKKMNINIKPIIINQSINIDRHLNLHQNRNSFGMKQKRET